MAIDTNIVLTGPEDDDDRDIDISPDVQPNIVDDVPKLAKEQTAREKREQERAERREERARQREQQQLQQAARREQQQRIQDEARRQSRAVRDRKRESQEVVRNVRAEAVNQRVQAYSLAAAVGLPGYVAASVIDRLFIQPGVDREVAQQEAYQQQLEAYRREQEDRATQDRRANSGSVPPLSEILPQGGRGSGGPPIPTPKGGRSGGGKGPPVAPPPKPTPQPPKVPAPIGSGSAGLAATGTAAGAALVATIGALRLVNQGVDSAAKTFESASLSAIQGTPAEGLRGVANQAQGIVDPLGVNVPLNVAVQGFDSLLSINEAIKDSIARDLGFAPQTLQETVQADLNKLVARIDNARRLDPVTAELARVNGQLDLAWEELRAEVIENIGPNIVTLLQTLIPIVQAMAQGVDIGSDAMSTLLEWLRLSPVAGTVLDLLGIIADNTADDINPNIDDGFLEVLNRFFDPGQAIGRAPNGALPPEMNP